MSVIKFDIGDRVVMIDNGEIRRGTIRKIFDTIGIGFVEFDGGEELEKVILVDIALEPKPDPAPEETNEPVDQLEVTVTPTVFARMALETVIDFTDDVSIAMMLNAFVTKLSKRMFTGVDDD